MRSVPSGSADGKGEAFNPNADLLRLQQDVVSAGRWRHPRGFLSQTILSVLLCRVCRAEGLAARRLAPSWSQATPTTSSNVFSSRGDRGRDPAGPAAESAGKSFVARRTEPGTVTRRLIMPLAAARRGPWWHWPRSTVAPFFHTESRFRSWGPRTL